MYEWPLFKDISFNESFSKTGKLSRSIGIDLFCFVFWIKPKNEESKNEALIY